MTQAKLTWWHSISAKIIHHWSRIWSIKHQPEKEKYSKSLQSYVAKNGSKIILRNAVLSQMRGICLYILVSFISFIGNSLKQSAIVFIWLVPFVPLQVKKEDPKEQEVSFFCQIIPENIVESEYLGFRQKTTFPRISESSYVLQGDYFQTKSL